MAGTDLWRGDLSPFGCEAVANPANAVCLSNRVYQFGVASRPNGDKSPRHRIPCVQGFYVYRVKVSLLTSAPGNNADAVARWL
jgi:hypothetical protein